MMQEVKATGPEGKDDLSKSSSKSPAENPALADIHAAMMEELGIGRKDTLPLQDGRSKGPPQKPIFSSGILEPKGFVPGVNTWRNAVFDDINPEEDKIDSIADGQLARIRRREQEEKRSESIPNSRAHSRTNLGPRSSSSNTNFPSSARIRSGKLGSQGSAATAQVATLHRSSNKLSDNLSSSHVNDRRDRRGRIQHSRVDSSIARLRAAVPAATTSKVSTYPQSSSGRPIGRQSSFDNRAARGSDRKKSIQDRPAGIKSAWGSLDENAFLAFAIKSPPLITSPSKKGFNNLSNENSNTNSSTTSDHKVSSTQDSGEKFLESDKVDQETKLIQNAREKKQEFQEPTQWDKTISLTDKEDQKSSVTIQEASCSQDVNKEARVKVQKDAGIGQPGIARLKGESGTLILELLQNDRTVVYEPIDDHANFVTDPMNTEYMIIYENTKRDPERKTTWRICFNLSCEKTSFMDTIVNFRSQEPKKSTSAVMHQPFRLSDSRNENESVSSTLLDTFENETNAYDNDLIHISSSPDKINSFHSSPSTKYDKIRTETLNDLSEIGDISAPVVSDKETFHDSKKLSNHSVEKLVDINDDILIESLYKQLTNNSEVLVIDLLLNILIRQDCSTVSSMKPDDISQSKRYLNIFKDSLTQLLRESRIFMQLPSAIASQYATDKAKKLVGKHMSVLKQPEFKISRVVEITSQLLVPQPVNKNTSRSIHDYSFYQDNKTQHSRSSSQDSQASDDTASFHSPALSCTAQGDVGVPQRLVSSISDSPKNGQNDTSDSIFRSGSFSTNQLEIANNDTVQRPSITNNQSDLHHKAKNIESLPDVKPRITYSIEDLLNLRSKAVHFEENILIDEVPKLKFSKSRETNIPDICDEKPIQAQSLDLPDSEPGHEKVDENLRKTQALPGIDDLSENLLVGLQIGLMSSRWSKEASGN
ncbi:putative bgh specific protein [Golovinomyces cichoracearum]|uniref:Putative bgh specific protein n=1 Tax=Golovinomyces cichoracearum TaxID=62708 RepID=A0A420I894_9PEZI|nr:putative bgh specific protein [Golovinomyces cichoracearum]